MPGLVLETTGVRGRCSSPVNGLMKNFEVLEYCEDTDADCHIPFLIVTMLELQCV